MSDFTFGQRIPTCKRLDYRLNQGMEMTGKDRKLPEMTGNCQKYWKQPEIAQKSDTV